jgi:hypothetical protein
MSTQLGSANKLTTAPTAGASTLGSSSAFRFARPAQNTPPVSDPILQRLYKIRDSYDDKSTSYRFLALVCNTKGGSALGGAAGKPASLTDQEWAEASASVLNPDTMAPAALTGFDKLDERSSSQVAICERMRSKLQELKGKIDDVHKGFRDIAMSRLEKLQANNNMINRQLMELTRIREVNGLKTVPFSADEAGLLGDLEKLQRDLEKPNKYVAALNALTLNRKFMRETLAEPPEIVLKETTRKRAEKVLEKNSEALTALISLVKDLNRQLAAMDTAIKRRF